MLCVEKDRSFFMSKYFHVCKIKIVSSQKFKVSSWKWGTILGLLFLLISPQVVFCKTGYDLRGEWKFSAKDDPSFAQNLLDDSAWGKVTLPENEKALKAGWYRYSIVLPVVSDKEKEYLGTEILIGNIEGNSAVYFNGRLIGETRGSGIYTHGRPQDYVIPPQAIKFGEANVIAIRVTGLGGGKGIGITGAPLVLAPLGDSYLFQRMHNVEDEYFRLLQQLPDVDTTKNKYGKELKELPVMLRRAREQQSNAQYAELARNLTDIESEIPKTIQAIVNHKKDIAGDPEDMPKPVTTGFESQARFGMLGRTFNDGLMLFNSNPAGFDYQYGTDAPYSVRYRGVTPERIYPTRMNWVTKTMRVDGRRQNKEVSYDVTHSAVFPGILLNINDREFSFTYTNAHAKCPDFMGYTGEYQATIVNPINPKTKKRITKVDLNVDRVKMPMGRNWLVFWFTGKYGTQESYPLEVVFENNMENISFKEDENGVTVFTVKSSEKMGHIAFIYPFGMQSFTGEAADRLRLSGFPKEFINTCDFWGSAVLQFPINCIEKYWVDDSAHRVDVLDQYVYEKLEDPWEIGRTNLAPIPPVLSQAVVHDYPVTFDQQGSRGLPKKVEYDRIYTGLNFLMSTKYGEYGAMVGPSYVEYHLPIPPMGKDESENQGIWASAKSKEELKQLINESVTVLGSPTAPNGVDRAFKGNAQAWMAYKYLNDENKKRLWDSATTATIKTFDPDIWNTEMEPFTKTSYQWTYFLEGPYYGKYDIDWGNGLPIYGFEKYAQYSGDWQAVENNWDQIKAANRYFNVGDSWMWMSVSNSDLGHGTGAGDCLCASYVSALATAKMAKELGDDSTYQSATYRAAKTAVPMLTRFWMNDYATENKMISKDQYVIGYLEDDGVLAISKKDDPWYMTSVLSGDGVEPEVFDLYMKYGKDALQKYENKFDEFYPHWSEGDYQYHRHFTYPDNSGYSTLPHIYSRYRLGYSMDSIMSYIHEAQKNRQMWWVAPNVLADIADKE